MYPWESAASLESKKTIVYVYLIDFYNRKESIKCSCHGEGLLISGLFSGESGAFLDLC